MMDRPLRIAVFVHEFPALSETFVLNQVTGLIDLGCDVTVFADGRRRDNVQHGDIARYALSEKTRYLAMPASRLRRLADAAALFMRNRQWRTWLLRSLNPVRFGREATSLKLFYWTLRLADDHRFDVVYCHFGLVGRIAAFLQQIGVLQGRLVTVFHGVDVSACLRRTPDLYRDLFARGDLFLPVSSYWQARLQAHGCDPARIAVQHMGVDRTRFGFRPRNTIGSAPLRLLTVGRMVEKKGVEFALHAVARVRDRGIAVRYTVVGDGPLRPQLEALAEQLELRGIVQFLGACSQDSVAALMYDNDVLLAPSVTDRDGDQEGIPVTLMEAMSTGMAVISSRHSGIPELVRHRETGLLAEERDVDGLAAAIGELATDPALRAAMGRKGHAFVAAAFDVGTLNARLLRLFQALCAEPPQESRSPVESASPARRQVG